MSDPRKLKAIEQFCVAYVQQYLSGSKSRREAIRDNPMEALEFFYGKAFMRRRRDSVSVAFRDRTLGALQAYPTLQDIDLSILDAQLSSARVNNRYDRQLCLGGAVDVVQLNDDVPQFRDGPCWMPGGRRVEAGAVLAGSASAGRQALSGCIDEELALLPGRSRLCSETERGPGLVDPAPA